MRNGMEEHTGGVLSGVEVGEVISKKKLKGLKIAGAKYSGASQKPTQLVSCLHKKE